MSGSRLGVQWESAGVALSVRALCVDDELSSCPVAKPPAIGAHRALKMWLVCLRSGMLHFLHLSLSAFECVRVACSHHIEQDSFRELSSSRGWVREEN